MGDMPEETAPLWYVVSPKELVETMISHLKFEITVAGAPIVVFSLGQALYSDHFVGGGIYWSSLFLMLSMVMNYLVISIAMQLQRAIILYDASDDKSQLRNAKILPLVHTGPIFLAKAGSASLTIGYLILGYALLF